MIRSNVYSGKDLCKILFEANLGRTPFQLVSEKINHVKYLKEYLGPKGLDAKFYLEEKEYISVDYLTDYSFYYSKNFVDYGNKCTRLHFFTYDSLDKGEFDQALSNAILKGNNDAQITKFWEDNYLGFIVIRPIPKFIIGYTVLKHYNFRNDKPAYDSFRNYWGIKTYDVHVFGNNVKIESLAFLSQDSNVAACATIAIWCMLQRAVENYYINLKSPYEITKDSGLTVHDGNRVFPNNGLHPVSICKAITESNLATEFRNLTDEKALNRKIKMIVNAYSRMKLPVIIGLSIQHNGQMGRHAAAIVGHRLDQKQLNKQPSKFSTALRAISKEPKMHLISDFINKIYIHDDQWGPFSRCEFQPRNQVSTSWNRHTADSKKGKALLLVIPVFQKVRIPFEDIEQYAFGLNKFLYKELGHEISGDLIWDIKLYFTSEFKKEVQQSGLIDIDDETERELLEKFMTMALPKYIWVSTLYVNGARILHFVYDATALRHTSSLLLVFSYYNVFINRFTSRLAELKEASKAQSAIRTNLEILFSDSLDHFIERVSILS